MASVHVCDICKKEGKLVETDTYMSVKGKPDLRIDYCSNCKPKFASMKIREYVKFVYKILHNMDLSEESTTTILAK